MLVGERVGLSCSFPIYKNLRTFSAVSLVRGMSNFLPIVAVEFEDGNVRRFRTRIFKRWLLLWVDSWISSLKDHRTGNSTLGLKAQAL